MNSERLQRYSKKILVNLARKKGIPGSATLRKDELVKILLRLDGPAEAKSQKPHSHRTAGGRKISANGTAKSHHTNGKNGKHVSNIPTKDLAGDGPGYSAVNPARDRIVVMVRDPYWLHCYWEVTRKAIQRAEAALAQDWHGSVPILRVLDVSSRDTTYSSETIVRDIAIHGGCNNWYIDVANPPRSYRIDIGYRSKRGQFFAIARSNVVTTPRAGVRAVVDENWSDIDSSRAEHIYAMSAGFQPYGDSLELKELFEERLRRPMGPPQVTGFGAGPLLAGKPRKFHFDLNAELIVFGSTEPTARVTLQGEPIKLRPDGSFAMRYSLPNSRQIIPAIASSADGVEERTIVLAVERNTRQMEPTVHYMNSE